MITQIWNNPWLFAAFILMAAYLIQFVLRRIMQRFLKRQSAHLQVDPTNYSFLKHALSFAVYTFAVGLIIYNIPSLHELGKTVFAGAGIFAAILAFASQQAFSNIIAGVFIVIFKPFRVGDYIEVEMRGGIVQDITLRHTVIQDFENKRIIIPNSMISSQTIVNNNIDDEKICKQILFKVPYDAPLDKVKEKIRELAVNHPFMIENRTQEEIDAGIPVVKVRVVDWGEYALQVRADVWAENPANAFQLKCDLNEQVKAALEEMNVFVPLPTYRFVPPQK